MTNNNKYIIYTVLLIFLGYLGIHRYYLKKWRSGLVYTCTIGILTIGWFADIVCTIKAIVKNVEVESTLICLK